MRTISTRLLLGMLVLAPEVALAQPSFDCAKASTPVEHAICRSDHLSMLDRLMAEVYSTTRKQMSAADRQRLLVDQRAWLASRDACGGDENCLSTRMADRIAALGRNAGSTSGASGGLPAGLAGHWEPYSDISSQDGVTLSPGVADFGIGGRYDIEAVRAGGRVFRITGRNMADGQLMCGYDQATYVMFMRAGPPVIGSGELLEVQFTAEATPMPEPSPGNPMHMLPGACSMGYYIR